MKKEIILNVHRINETNSRLATDTNDKEIIRPETAKKLYVNLGQGNFEIKGAFQTYLNYGTLNSPEIY